MTTLTLTSVILAIITPIIGVISVFSWEYKPQRMTRFLIVILSGIILGSMMYEERWPGFYLALIQFFGSCIYFILSFKYGMWGRSRLDIGVFISVILIGLVWYMTESSRIALVLSIVVHAVAFVPTFLKTWLYPRTESWIFYGCDVFAGLVSLFAISQIFTFGAIFSWYVFFLNLSMVLIIVLRRRYLLQQKISN